MINEQVRIALTNQAAIHQQAGLRGAAPSDEAVETMSKALELLSAFDSRIGRLDGLIERQRQWLEMQW